MGYRVVTIKQFSGKINRLKSNDVVDELLILCGTDDEREVSFC